MGLTSVISSNDGFSASKRLAKLGNGVQVVRALSDHITHHASQVDTLIYTLLRHPGVLSYHR